MEAFFIYMKLFLKKILSFSLGLFVVAISLDLFFSESLKRSHDFAEGECLVWNDVFNGSINCDVVIYGSSRAWVHVSPKILSNSLGLSVYNLGVDGHSVYMQRLRHNQFLKYNKLPKTVIYSLDFFTLRKKNGFYNYKQLFPYMLFDKDIYHGTESFDFFDFADFLLPVTRYSHQSSELFEVLSDVYLKDTVIPSRRIRGYKGEDLTWNESERINRNGKTKKLDVGVNEKEWFELILNDYQRLGVQVVFVYSPEHISAQNYITNREEIFKIYLEYAKKYNIPFLDYSKSDVCKDSSNFYNSVHLHKQGAEEFSRVLAKDLNDLIRIENR